MMPNFSVVTLVLTSISLRVQVHSSLVLTGQISLQDLIHAGLPFLSLPFFRLPL